MKSKYNVSTAVIDSATVVFVDLQNGRYRCVKNGGTYVIYSGMYSLGFVETLSTQINNVITVKEARV